LYDVANSAFVHHEFTTEVEKDQPVAKYLRLTANRLSAGMACLITVFFSTVALPSTFDFTYDRQPTVENIFQRENIVGIYFTLMFFCNTLDH
jgi:hypothetical protein